MFINKSITKIVQDIISDVLKVGDTAADATMGNGNDTLFLAESVGRNGFVYSFDIQKEALINTEKLLIENNISNVKLIKDSHDNIDKYGLSNLKAVMFNLGYMPNTDKNIITKSETTIPAIEKAMCLLLIGGIITITSYYGHEGGLEEKNSVERFLTNINKQFLASKIDFINRNNNPPIIYVIEKVK